MWMSRHSNVITPVVHVVALLCTSAGKVTDRIHTASRQDETEPATMAECGRFNALCKRFSEHTRATTVPTTFCVLLPQYPIPANAEGGSGVTDIVPKPLLSTPKEKEACCRKAMAS